MLGPRQAAAQRPDSHKSPQMQRPLNQRMRLMRRVVRRPLVTQAGGGFMAGSGTVSLRPMLVVLVLGALALSLLAWWAGQATIRKERRSIADCRQRYAGAHSLTDSGAVDMVYLTTYWEQAAGRRASRTCGDLRLAGKLR